MKIVVGRWHPIPGLVVVREGHREVFQPEESDITMDSTPDVLIARGELGGG